MDVPSSLIKSCTCSKFAEYSCLSLRFCATLSILVGIHVHVSVYTARVDLELRKRGGPEKMSLINYS